MANYLTEQEVKEFNAKKDENGRVWNGEREYSVLNKEKVGDEIKYSLTTFKENVTNDTIYFTEELDKRYAREHFTNEHRNIGSSKSPFYAGAKDNGKNVVYEEENGKTIPITRREEIFNDDVFLVKYTLLDGSILDIKYTK